MHIPPNLLLVSMLFNTKHLKNFSGHFPARVPGPGSDFGAAAVEGDMRGVGGEPRQDAIRISVRKRVDLHRVVGSSRHQLPFL